MSIPGSASPLLLASTAAAAGGYQVSRSLRFNSADSAYLSRTPAVVGNKRIWSFSVWVKRAAPSGGTQTPLISTSYETGGNRGVDFGFGGSDNLNFSGYNDTGGNNFTVVTSSVYRDFSAWMHLLIAVDTTQATPANRVRIYVNDQEVTTFSSNTYPTQNDYLELNSTEAHFIGCLNLNGTPQRFVNAYLAECYLIDGQQLTPSSFTEVSATTGQLIPKAYTGTFGTNGFWLKFSDNSAATAAALGNDYSGNNNDWTPNNLSVTAGAGNDSLVDTPTSISATDTGVGGEIRGNYATLNPLTYPASSLATFSNGNLNVVEATGGDTAISSTIGVLRSSGKYYWEFTINAVGGEVLIGINAGGTTQYLNAVSYTSTGVKTVSTPSGWNGGQTGYGSSYTAGDVIGIALDTDTPKLTFYKNGVSQGDITSGVDFSVYFSHSMAVGGGHQQNYSANFGQRAFAYPVSGFKALCDTNIAEGTITTSGTYTGNGVADGPFVYLNGIPTAMTIGVNAVTFGTHADKLSNGFKLRTTNVLYNQNALSYSYSITTTGAKFKFARAQPNP